MKSTEYCFYLIDSLEKSKSTIISNLIRYEFWDYHLFRLSFTAGGIDMFEYYAKFGGNVVFGSIES